MSCRMANARPARQPWVSLDTTLGAKRMMLRSTCGNGGEGVHESDAGQVSAFVRPQPSLHAMSLIGSGKWRPCDTSSAVVLERERRVERHKPAGPRTSCSQLPATAMGTPTDVSVDFRLFGRPRFPTRNSASLPLPFRGQPLLHSPNVHRCRDESTSQHRLFRPGVLERLGVALPGSRGRRGTAFRGRKCVQTHW